MPETLHPLAPLTFPLHGSRLIEASAGTGKTWTIAALVVRLVLDGLRRLRPIARRRAVRSRLATARPTELLGGGMDTGCLLVDRVGAGAAQFQVGQSLGESVDALLEPFQTIIVRRHGVPPSG